MIHAVKNGIPATFTENVWMLMGESKNGWVQVGDEAPLPEIPSEVKEFVSNKPIKTQEAPEEKQNEVVAVEVNVPKTPDPQRAKKYVKDKATLIAELEKLGIKVDKRASPKALQEQYREKTGENLKQ